MSKIFKVDREDAIEKMAYGLIMDLMKQYRLGKLSSDDYERRRWRILWDYVPHLCRRDGRITRRKFAETSIWCLRNPDAA